MRIHVLFHLLLIQLWWSPNVHAEESVGLQPNQFFSELAFQPGAGDYIVSSANQSARRLSKELYLRFGVRLKAPVTIVVGRDLPYLYTETSRILEGDVNFDELSAVYDSQCNRSIGGFAKAKVVVICFSQELYEVNRSFDLPESITAHQFNAELSEIISHETFHSFQFQAANIEGVQPFHADPRFGAPGPYWLLEGSALYVGLRSSFSMTDVRNIARFAQSNGFTSLNSCAVISKYQDSFSIDEGASGEVLSMVSQLADRFGEQSLSEFYIAIGDTRDWELAFQSTFSGPLISAFNCAFNNQVSRD